MPDQDPIEKRYLFQGSAVPFAAHIRRPVDEYIPSVASSAIPVTGGVASASVGKQTPHEIFSFDSASSSVSGDFADRRRAADFTNGNHGENDLSTQTFVDSQLNGLKVVAPQGGGKVTTFSAQQLHARLGSFSDRRKPTEFRALEAIFNGVYVDGQELIVKTAPEVCTHNETYDKLVKTYEEDGNFRKQYGSLFYATGNEKTGMGALLTKHVIPNSNGLLLGTIATSLRFASGKAPAGTEIHGNRLTIQGLGSIYFAEIVIDRYSRRLTLLRFQLGSDNGVDGTACESSTGGQGYPPGTN